jgi:hypothetical protein
MGMVGQWTDSVLAAVDTQGSAEGPVNSFFDRVIEEVRQGRDDRETELELELASHSKQSKRGNPTPIGNQVRMKVLFAPLTIRPEYFTTLWIVKAGNPILAILWNTARFAITIR